MFRETRSSHCHSLGRCLSYQQTPLAFRSAAGGFCPSSRQAEGGQRIRMTSPPRHTCIAWATIESAQQASTKPYSYHVGGEGGGGQGLPRRSASRLRPLSHQLTTNIGARNPSNCHRSAARSARSKVALVSPSPPNCRLTPCSQPVTETQNQIHTHSCQALSSRVPIGDDTVLLPAVPGLCIVWLSVPLTEPHNQHVG